MRIFYALGYLAGSAILAASRPSEVDRLRAENRDLARDLERVAKIADSLRVDLSRAEAMLQHPSHRGAVGTSRDDLMDVCDAIAIGDALLELDATDTLGDILYSHGEGWSR